MARRRLSAGTQPPPELLEFVPEQWPGPTVDGGDFDAWARWQEARQEWHETHGWPGGEEGWVAAQQEAPPAPDAPWDPEWRWPPSAREVHDELVAAGDVTTADAIRAAVDRGSMAEARDLAAEAREG